MSLHVHGMAIAAERNLLPTQAAKGWQIEEAVEVRKRAGMATGRRVTMPSVPALSRLGQVLLAMAALLRQVSF
jgi:hypothetical protein